MGTLCRTISEPFRGFWNAPPEVRNEARLEDFLECEVARSNDASEDPEPTAEVQSQFYEVIGTSPKATRSLSRLPRSNSPISVGFAGLRYRRTSCQFRPNTRRHFG